MSDTEIGNKKEPTTPKSSGDFIPEKTADEIIDDLRKSRNFTRDTIPLDLLESIERGIKQAQNGQTISLMEFTKKHLSNK